MAVPSIFDLCKPRDDVAKGTISDSDYAANLANVLTGSHLARRQDRRPELLEAAKSWDLVILDEAHHARTKGAGTSQAKGPNRLLQLMRSLKLRTGALVLLTATPLQVHASELWDLLELLGLPQAWTPDAFVRFFSEVAKPTITNEGLDWLSALFRANEAKYGETSKAEAEQATHLSGLKTRRVLEALRDEASILGDSFRPKSVGPPLS